MALYPYVERDKAYTLIDQMTTMTDLVEQIGQGKADANPELQAAIAQMTGATDLQRQHRALSSLLTKIKTNHSDRIFGAAKQDFSAYVEAINPEEACRSRVHRFLAAKLQEMAEVPEMRRAVSMPPGHAKDLDVNTPVLMADGTSKRLGDIEIGDFVITHTGNAGEVTEVHDQGVRETIILRTLSNRAIRAHPDHPFLTPSGWVPAKELVVGDVLAQQREFAIANTSGRTREEFAMAGYMMAAGMIRGRRYSRMFTIENMFRTDDALIIEDVCEIARNLGYPAFVRMGMHYGGEVRTVTFGETFKYWLETQGLWKAKRRTMRIPEWVFKGSYSEIGAFVGSIFAMDANLVPKRNRHSGAQRQLRVTTRNGGLVKDLRRLLMRLGARCAYNEVLHGNYNYEPTTFHSLIIAWDEDIAFLRKALRIRGDNKRFWDKPIPVRKFFDARYGEDQITAIDPAEPTETRCLSIEGDHSFLADGIVVHNSTYCSRLFPSWWLGKNDNKKWIQGGHTQRFAEKEFGKKLRDQIVEKPAYQKVFPGLGIRSASVDEIILQNDSSYIVKGVGQGISGYRSNFNNIDDPYPTEKAAQSEVTRNTVWDWFTNDFRTRRLPGAGELIIVTRWHSDDIIGRLEDLIKAGEVEPWDIINLPAFSLGEDVDQLNRKKDEVLWPEFFTKQFLLDIKGPMTQSRFESLYQGSPVLAEGNILQRKWIKYYSAFPETLGQGPSESSVGPLESVSRNRIGGPSEFSNRPLESNIQNPVFRVRCVVSVDSAEKETARADHTAIQCWILGSDLKHYLVDCLTDKFDFPRLIEHVENMAKKWSADVILMEEKGAGNQYIQARQGLAPCSIIGINPGRIDKSMRFDGTMLMWQAGEVLLPSRASWLSTYIDELLRFPQGKRDDNVDATSQYLNWSKADGGWQRGTRKVGGG